MRMSENFVSNKVPNYIVVLHVLFEQKNEAAIEYPWLSENIWSASMKVRHEQQNPSDGLTKQRVSNDLVKLIRKLRWMGMDEEAQTVENQLSLCKADTVVARSCETD